MPLPEILKRRNKAGNSPEKVVKRPQKLPLEGIELESHDEVDHLDQARLVTCLDDILFKNVALGYFLQYLDFVGQSSLMKFWLDVSSFQAAVKNHHKEEVISPGNDSLDSGINSDLSSASKLSNLSGLTEDAVQIYQRYVSPDCPYPVELSLDQKQDIVRGICTEDGQIDYLCFDAAKNYVYSLIEDQFYSDFLRSAFYAKYEMEVFSIEGGVTIQGILNHDVLLFHFMEFMETVGKTELALVEFWITAKNFQNQDAMLIYEKFFSLQASCPLGFSNKVRLKIEEAICSPIEGQIKSDCFEEAVKIVESVLQSNFLKSFTSSQLFSNYIAGLSTTIEKAPLTSTSRQRSVSGSSLNTTCSSETLSSLQNISTKNTLLASMSKKKVRKNPDFLDKSTEPDFLWRRNQSVLTNIGHVDHLGRYISSLDLPPDTIQKRSVMMQPNMKTRISKAVRKIVTNEDMERLKEEMAWQMAELVITDVINRTKFPPEDDEVALSNLGAPSTPSRRPIFNISHNIRKVSS